MTKNLLAIARLEFVGAARLKWLRLLTAAFATLALAAAYSAGGLRSFLASTVSPERRCR